jgi:hypothetical protein
MTDEKNDMIPPEKNPASSFDNRLRELLPGKELDDFKKQLPPEFISDAEEGLGKISDSRQLDSVLKKLNQHMHHQLSVKKQKKKSNEIGNLNWSYWAILIILILIFACYLVIRQLLHR